MLSRPFGDWTRRQSAVEPRRPVTMDSAQMNQRQQILESILRTTRWPTQHNVAAVDAATAVATQLVVPPGQPVPAPSSSAEESQPEVEKGQQEKGTACRAQPSATAETAAGQQPLLSKSLENDEWSEFLDGTLEDAMENPSMLEHRDLVAVVVAPLRNSNADPALVERIATLLAMPWAVRDAEVDDEALIRAYADTRVVANLLYACKVMVQRRSSLNRSSGYQLL